MASRYVFAVDVLMRAPSTAAQATLDYFMTDYVDHLEMHVRQILSIVGTA